MTLHEAQEASFINHAWDYALGEAQTSSIYQSFKGRQTQKISVALRESKQVVLSVKRLVIANPVIPSISIYRSGSSSWCCKCCKVCADVSHVYMCSCTTMRMFVSSSAEVLVQQSHCCLAVFQSLVPLTPTQLSTSVCFIFSKVLPNLSSSSLTATLNYDLIFH